MTRTYTIYVITGPDGREYIGCTIQPLATRFLQHLSPANQTLNKQAIGHKMRELGPENFTIRALVTGLSFDEARAEEARLIAERDACGRGYNLRKGGAGFGRTYQMLKRAA